MSTGLPQRKCKTVHVTADGKVLAAHYYCRSLSGFWSAACRSDNILSLERRKRSLKRSTETTESRSTKY